VKLLLQQLGTLGEVLGCTTLCRLSPHLCLPRANQTRQIWAMGRGGATASVGFYCFFCLICVVFLSVCFEVPSLTLEACGLKSECVCGEQCFGLQRSWPDPCHGWPRWPGSQHEVARNLANVLGWPSLWFHLADTLTL